MQDPQPADSAGEKPNYETDMSHKLNAHRSLAKNTLHQARSRRTVYLHRRAAWRADRLVGGPIMGKLTIRLGSIAGAACIAAGAAITAASAQQQAPPRGPGEVTGLVVMTPNGPATCATWVQWRSPGANPIDKASIVFWVEGYLSGLAAGSHHDVIGLFRTKDLAAWLDQYCRANPQTKLQIAVDALGIEMVRHAGGQL